ncbi:MAG: hypothetical protein U0746_08405 [Gemmataceae bacterium]
MQDTHGHDPRFSATAAAQLKQRELIDKEVDVMADPALAMPRPN